MLLFPNCKAFPEVKSDPHYLLKIPQLCRSQATVKKIEIMIYCIVCLPVQELKHVQVTFVHTLSPTNEKLTGARTMKLHR